MKSILLSTLLLLLTGCSLVTKEQCRHHNWYGRGYNDAKKNLPASYGQHYFQACRNQGIYLDISPWQRGYQKQIKEQCPISKAKSLASSQVRYSGPCFSDPEFAVAFRKAEADAKAKAHLNALENEVKQIQAERNKLQGKQDPATQSRIRELDWRAFQLDQELLELRQPLAVDAEPVNRF